MNSKVKIQSQNEHNETEWTQDFEASTMAATKAQASRYINCNLFTDETTIEKEQITEHYQIWEIK